MGSDWSETTLGKVVNEGEGLIQTGPFGSQLHASDYKTNGIPVIMPVNISSDRVDTRDIARISREDAGRLAKHIVEAGDIVYSRRGDVTRKALITDREAGMFCGTGCLLVRPGDAIDPLFLKYHLSTPRNQEWIVRHAVGATMPNLNTSILENVPLCIPSLSHQKAIAHILGTLDDKIELNRRMNGTLESMARALFKSWFVDFDPVIDNALAAGHSIPDPLAARASARRALGPHRKPLPENIRTLFPASFTFDEQMGWIPDGWEVEPLGDHVQLQRGKTYKSKLKGEPGPYLLGLGSIGRNGGFRSDKLMTYGGECPENLLVYPGDLFVSLKDVTQAADLLGAVARVPTSIEVGRMTQDTVKLLFNDGAVSRNILYRLLRTSRYRDFCRSHATGTTNLGLAREDFLAYPVIVPSVKVQNRFDDFMADTEKRIDRNERDCITLTKLRDTLLPKLLSGELRIPEAEKLVADSV